MQETKDFDEELLTYEKQPFWKKHFKWIICLLILVIIIIILIAILSKGKNNSSYEFGLSMEELQKRTSDEFLGKKILLKSDSEEYNDLDSKDKICLKHLLKAGVYLENIQYQIDNPHNIPFKKFLEDEIEKDNERANLTKILFDGQKGINALDSLSNEVNLALNHKIMPGIGVYPEDLSKEEYHKILIKMLKENKIDLVKNITNQRSIVVRDGKYLKPIDYVEYFKEDFSKMADEFEEAAKFSTNKDFATYLNLQANALRIADPMLDAEADKVWADLQETPLELTLTRENYQDSITGSFIENQELTDLLKENNITPVPKDCLGLRVGIINKKGTDNILKIKKFLPLLADNMPYKEEYTRENSTEMKQTMVDADLVMLFGDVGAYRAGITLAENLPNDDKLSLQIGGGRRNVYHRQIRFVTDQTKVQERLDAILDKEQHKYYENEADHWFTIGHENAHSLGPIINNSKLGEYRNILEENKADMASIAFIDLLKENGYYTEDQRKQIIVSVIIDNFLKVKPNMSQTHRVRTLMQNYYMYKNDAFYLTDDKKIHINIDNVVPAAKSMLKEIIRIQLDNKFEDAKKYVEENFIWNEIFQTIGDKLQKLSNVLNCVLENELGDQILKEN